MVFKYGPVWMGTASGTLLSSLALIKIEDVLTTVILAAIGALVSFGISYFLNFNLKYKEDKSRKSKKK